MRAESACESGVCARACRETTGPGPCGVKRHRLGIGTVDGRSLWTGVWLCGRAEEGQRPVTAHGCSGCPLWQPCAATGRWHDCMIGTSGPCAPGECSLKAWVLTKNTVPKTKTLAFSLNSVAEDRFRKSKNRAVRNVPEMTKSVPRHLTKSVRAPSGKRVWVFWLLLLLLARYYY